MRTSIYDPAQLLPELTHTQLDRLKTYRYQDRKARGMQPYDIYRLENDMIDAIIFPDVAPYITTVGSLWAVVGFRNGSACSVQYVLPFTSERRVLFMETLQSVLSRVK